MRLSFAAHLTRLASSIHRAPQIIELLEARVLNVQGKQHALVLDRAQLQDTLNGCFGDAPAARELTAAHIADGFDPVPLERRSRAFDPADLTRRAYEHWQTLRWPGRTGRLAFARTLYAVCMLQQSAYLSLRVWDDGADEAPARFREIQHLLDALNDTATPIVFVRDARWLLQIVQGPLTRHLAPYFTVAQRIAESFPDRAGVEIHKAGAKLAGGHLRSQLHYRSLESGATIDSADVLMATRNSNSMDVALLVQDLVPLLDAYLAADEEDDRRGLADAILQGVSADPELLLDRLDLLGPYTIIEDVFLEGTGDEGVRYTTLGARHETLLERYRELIAAATPRIRQDAASLDPSSHAYSPLGITYGFCADVLASMALSTLTTSRLPDVTLEDVFASGGSRGDVRSLADKHLDYSPGWAQQVFARAVAGLGARPVTLTRLYVIPEAQHSPVLPEGVLAGQDHCVTSDLQRALATGATAFPKSQILLDRREGRFLASAECGGSWFGVSKSLLTACASGGRGAYIKDVPAPVVQILRRTCPGLVQVLS